MTTTASPSSQLYGEDYYLWDELNKNVIGTAVMSSIIISLVLTLDGLHTYFNHACSKNAYAIAHTLRRNFHYKMTNMGLFLEACEVGMGFFVFTSYTIVWGSQNLRKSWPSAAPVYAFFLASFNVFFIFKFILQLLMKKAKRAHHFVLFLTKLTTLTNIVSFSSGLLGAVGYSNTLLNFGCLRFPTILVATERILRFDPFVHMLFCTDDTRRKNSSSRLQVRRKIASIVIGITMVILSMALVIYLFETLGDPKWIAESPFFVSVDQNSADAKFSVFEAIYVRIRLGFPRICPFASIVIEYFTRGSLECTLNFMFVK